MPSKRRLPWRSARTAIATLAAAFAGATASEASGRPKTSLVSVNAARTGGGDGGSAGLSISANGRFAWFQSQASDLVANDTNGAFDVFLRDLRLGTTTLVSVNAAGTDSGNGASLVAALSANGRFMLFDSDAGDLVANDANGKSDVFLRDLKTRKTALVSVNGSGSGSADDASFAAQVSASGRYVLFQSDAGDVVAGLAHSATDVYVRDMKTATTALVSVNAAGTGGGDADSRAWSLTPNGRFALFESDAGDLVPGTSGGTTNVYLRDMKTRTTALVSVNASGTGGGNGTSSAGLVTPNGRYVLFGSDAEDLVAVDGNGRSDVFVRDMKTGTTTLVSVVASGARSGDGDSSAAQISPNGRFVLFESDADDLVAGDVNGKRDVFVRDLRTRTTTLVSASSAGTGGSNGDSSASEMTANGRYVLFESDGGDIAAGDANATGDVFLRDMKKRTTTLVSANVAGSGAGDGLSGGASMSANGGSVLFSSFAGDLVAGDSNAAEDAFVRTVR